MSSRTVQPLDRLEESANPFVDNNSIVQGESREVERLNVFVKIENR